MKKMLSGVLLAAIGAAVVPVAARATTVAYQCVNYDAANDEGRGDGTEMILGNRQIWINGPKCGQKGAALGDIYTFSAFMTGQKNTSRVYVDNPYNPADPKTKSVTVTPWTNHRKLLHFSDDSDSKISVICYPANNDDPQDSTDVNN